MGSRNDHPSPFLPPPSKSPTLFSSSASPPSLPPPPELPFTQSSSFSLAAGGVEPPPKLSSSSSGSELLQSKEHLVFRDKPLFSSSPSSSSPPSFPGFRRSAALEAFAPSHAEPKIASFRALPCPGELKTGSSLKSGIAASSSAPSMTGKGQPAKAYQACSRHGLETHLPPSSHSSSQLSPRPGANTPTVDTGSAEDSEVPRPLEALQVVPIPAFLSKTYEFVDDASMDAVVSWGPSGESFVVWDPVEFSRTVLPRHFKHNNFSSFVRQLNTYGFHKIDTDRWEFANENFLRGHKHLLRNIHRRRSSHVQQIGSYVGSSMELGGFGAEDEVEKMRKDKNLLMQEAVKLQKEHLTMIHQLETVKQRMQLAELRQKRLVSFLSRALQNPAFLNYLSQEKEQRKIASSRISRKFLKHPKSNDSELVSLCERQLVEYRQTVDGVSSSANQVTETHVPCQLTDHLFQEVGDELDVNEDIEEEFTQASVETGERIPAFIDDASDTLFKGEDIMISPMDTSSTAAAAAAAAAAAEYFVSFPEVIPEEMIFLNAIPEENEDPILAKETWDMNFMDGASLDNPANDVWDKLFDGDTQERGVEAGSSMSWCIGAGAGDLEIDTVESVHSRDMKRPRSL